MDVFIKISAGALMAAILCLVISKRDKDISMLLLLTVCCMIFAATGIYLKPILSFFESLRNSAELNPEIFKILLQSTGVGILSEISALICSDMGNSALGKTIQVLSSVMILYLSLPLFQRFIELITGIMGGI